MICTVFAINSVSIKHKKKHMYIASACLLISREFTSHEKKKKRKFHAWQVSTIRITMNENLIVSVCSTLQMNRYDAIFVNALGSFTY